MEVREQVRRLNAELIELRRDFHQHPEVGLEEFRTSGIVSDYLLQLGMAVSRPTETGVVGLLKGKQTGRTLMLRADMDALPIQEENNVAYKSINDGKMHACGHDGHTAMLLIAAKILSGYKHKIRGNIKFLFQPNEENMGAGLLIEKGVLANPRVDAACGIHLMAPLQTGKIGISSGPVMAGMHAFKLILRGKGGHTGFPQESVDPIITAASIIQAVQVIQSREIDVLKPTLIVFGKISGGTIYNVIPDKIEIEGSIRYLYDIQSDSKEQPLGRFERIVKNICDAHRIKYDVEYAYSHPAVINDTKMTNFVSVTAEKVVESKDSIMPFVTMIGEDFCEFANRVPSAFYFIGSGNKEKGTDHPHHHSCFNIDEDALAIGVEMHVRTALSILGNSI
jgi:amidohydrolase